MKFLIKTFILFLFFSATAHANQFYRHVPFSVEVATHDKVTVNYDLANQSGIRCAAKNAEFWVEFVYKGRKKTALLPATLINNRLPAAEDEELTDASGQFHLVKDKGSKVMGEVECEFIK